MGPRIGQTPLMQAALNSRGPSPTTNPASPQSNSSPVGSQDRTGKTDPKEAPNAEGSAQDGGEHSDEKSAIAARVLTRAYTVAQLREYTPSRLAYMYEKVFRAMKEEPESGHQEGAIENAKCGCLRDPGRVRAQMAIQW